MSSVVPRRAGLFILALVAVLGGLVFRLGTAPPPEVEIATYGTDLGGRTGSQRHNAALAAQSIDGAIVPPGAVFSFNHTVKPWTMDQGYVKAPVSYDGEMVRAYGGGVCQTSTTLYNAALLAGLAIVERHPHVFAAHYAPPGQDAAVAQKDIDLRVRNPYPWPIRLRAKVNQDRLDIRVLGAERPKDRVQIVPEILSTTRPRRLTRFVPSAPGRPGVYLRNPGMTGYRVVTYRVFVHGGREVRRERLSDDTYKAMDRVVSISDPS